MKNNMKNMMSLDVFMASLSEGEQNAIKNHLQGADFTVANLMCWDIYLNYYHKIGMNLTLEQDLSAVKKLAKQFHWKNNLDEIIKNNPFEALVITDKARNIIWVNKGFSKMTGYSKKFAVNKTPSFLQARDTTCSSRKRIAEKLSLDEPFREVITNYKKDKTPYKCELHIFPLYNRNTTHFLALERRAI